MGDTCPKCAPTTKSSASEESPRCVETATSGERCTKLLVNGAAHPGLHTFVAGPDPMPAPSATPEPDRSGWPVLVKQKFHDGGTVYRTAGSFDAPAVWPGNDGEWYSTPDSLSLGTEYQTATEAADAIHARLPDEVPEWKDAPPPDPRDAEIADLRRQVEAFRRAACVATGWGEDTTPGDATLIEALRGKRMARWEALEDAERHRAERAEAEVARLTAALQGAKVATFLNPTREHALALLDLAASGNPALVHIAALLRL